jgi:DNA topoisomerase VI subunit B
MANHSYPVEVQSDFLEKITRAKPVQALAEFIWNSLDADSSTLKVTVEQNELGAMSKVIVRNNGTGIKYEKAAELFSSLGGSWKRTRAVRVLPGLGAAKRAGRRRVAPNALAIK